MDAGFGRVFETDAAVAPSASLCIIRVLMAMIFFSVSPQKQNKQ
jgi:hypothetical protein